MFPDPCRKRIHNIRRNYFCKLQQI